MVRDTAYMASMDDLLSGKLTLKERRDLQGRTNALFEQCPCEPEVCQ